MLHLRVVLTWMVLLLLGVGQAHAADGPPPMYGQINFKLTVEQQDLNDIEVRPNSFQSTRKLLKITNKDLLALLATYHATTYPDGATLRIDPPYIRLFVFAQDGTTVLTSVSGAVCWFGALAWTSQGTRSVPPLPYKSNAKDSVVFEVMLDLGSPLIQFHLYGIRQDLTKQNYDTSAATVTTSGRVLGNGAFGGASAIFYGTISTHRIYTIY